MFKGSNSCMPLEGERLRNRKLKKNPLQFVLCTCMCLWYVRNHQANYNHASMAPVLFMISDGKWRRRLEWMNKGMKQSLLNI